MNLLFRVLYATHCRSTHHKLAMDALRYLVHPEAERWQNLFLKHHKQYLFGAKAPDTNFKDFRNHVLHVRHNYWGGALKAARKWYDLSLAALKRKSWSEAVYSAGVLSHYFTDPIQPFHTDQSEAENNVHRAVEWSICKDYYRLRAYLEQEVREPYVEIPNDYNWLEALIVRGAELARSYYELLIDHYDFDKGVTNPSHGLDGVSREFLAGLIGFAAAGFARVLERMFQEAAVHPPRSTLTLETFLTTLSVPIQWVTSNMHDAKERRLVRAMHDELWKSGRVDETLPEDDRVIRDLVREEIKPARSSGDVLPVSLPSTTAPRFFLELTSDVEEAPSIGPKTAARLAEIGVLSVADLLEADPEQAAAKLDVAHIKPSVISAWQDQARLVCQIPQLRGHDAQTLVACGYHRAEDVAAAARDDLLFLAVEFANSSEGERVLRSSKKPDAEEVGNWIRWARQARPLRAA